MNKNYSYSQHNLIEIDSYIHTLHKEVTITGNKLTIPEIISVASGKAKTSFTQDKKIIDRIKETYRHMMKDVENGIPVYGCNTGYGARASRVLIDGTKKERVKIAREMSEGIVHVDVSVGPQFDKEVVRSAILIRINMLMQGVSAVKLEDLEKYRQLLNNFITPVVNQYGGIGASGDLAHNGRVLSALRQIPGTKVFDAYGNLRQASDALKEVGIEPLKLDPKAGLGFVNGDNFSNSLAISLAVNTLEVFLLSTVLGAMVIEVLEGTDRSFHPLLAAVRPHNGQKELAMLYRYLLNGSKLAYQEMTGHTIRPKGIKVQDVYSLRCIAQYQGVNVEKIKHIFDILTVNANAVSDNPLWVPPEFVTHGEKPWQWVSGGNFIASHMVDAMDNLRKVLTHIVKLNDRHLARMVNPYENNRLTANLSDKAAITQCVFKGVQIQSGMFDVYSSLLSIPVSTFFGIHEEGNQDITSHALTSGIFGLENLRITRYSVAQNLMAVAQGVDLRGGPKYLSPQTRPMYEFIRERVDYIKKEKPLYNDIETIYQSIISGEMIDYLRRKIFNNFYGF
ncbi:hypothetical protein A3A93_05850 [Candidatus Roizmanbacteria bacterium RIFCSPLOWO2_01_FULL_38_12]|uniref:Histidine ammonia-lyase n=1 Tax=Candidatus Roizmanbacteria bacterium RIFCSPLOWO2_01_FULL_38_12 TaxID=1802061 RepID=A0A1F7IVB8_9BACT|nr:MAG: hypothetical protein A3F59_03490 [Candidatus Roizmanbacteria bacterium RIFCSPHIGHO2_12_FULL_38_13]OGK47284.1 MAG: hypothetical protein A3A93_05850 [Candidatus Roizmanbacteria bacterium RIFCSPLOWO2_01_FULL_38_12]